MARKDAELKTIEAMTTRITSLRSRADTLCAKEDRGNTAIAFNKRQASIAKLNARAEALHGKRAGLLRAEREAAVENNLDAFFQ